ncbi:MAG: type II and III secretion system protein family protein [Nitrospinota bacterium]
MKQQVRLAGKFSGGFLAVLLVAGVPGEGLAQERKSLISMDPLVRLRELHLLKAESREHVKSRSILLAPAVKKVVIEGPAVPVNEFSSRRNGRHPEGNGSRVVNSGVPVLKQRRVKSQLLAQAAQFRSIPKTPSYPVDEGVTTLRVTAKKTMIISVPYTIQRVFVGETKLADVRTISSREFLVSAKTPGTTNLIVWDERGRKFVFTLLVQADAEALARGIREVYPKESLKVSAVKDSIVLSGVTARSDVKKVVGKMAESFAPKKVINLVRVDALPVQISLKVRIAEVGRTAIRELGLSFLALGRLGAEPGSFGVFPGDAFTPPTGSFNVTPSPDLNFGSLVNFFIADSARNLGLFLRALEAKGDLRTLAEPRLVTLSGKKASFLAGGEFPVPIPQAGAGASITIEFKPFGVRLDFTPKVIDKNRIELKLAPEVSELDFSNSVSVGGFSVPSLTKRRTETVVELEDGQTFAIAGLIQNRMVKDISKVPWIADIPILGKLFTSERFNRQETELLILVTPEIVKHSMADDPMPLPRGASLGRGM